jgi:hypothetical protein
MTKKSAARQAKDAHAKHIKKLEQSAAILAAPGGNKVHDGWDRLHALHKRCVEMMKSHALTTNVLANEELHDCFGDKKARATLVSNMRLLSKDVVDHIAQLGAIYEQHKDRTGGEINPEEGMQVITIHELYTNWMMVHDANIMPVWMEIMDAVGRAEQEYHRRVVAANAAAAQKAASDVLDPSVTTDVEFKEVAEVAAEPTQA